MFTTDTIRLKIEFRKECWFDSGQGHQEFIPIIVSFQSECLRLLKEKVAPILRACGPISLMVIRSDGHFRSTLSTDILSGRRHVSNVPTGDIGKEKRPPIEETVVRRLYPG